jgi:hypothetical protein
MARALSRHLPVVDSGQSLRGLPLSRENIGMA